MRRRYKENISLISKKLLLVIALNIIFISSQVLAADVGYVVKSSPNPIIVSILNEQNLSYDIITDSQIQITNFSNYKVILVQDKVVNKQYLPLNNTNSIFLNKEYIPYVWTGDIIMAMSNTMTSKFDKLGTEFTEGFTDFSFMAYTTPKAIEYISRPKTYINRVALTTGSSGSYPIVAYSNDTQKKTVFFGFKEIDYWTNDTRNLFKNSLKWLSIGSDLDRDGIYSNEDCNDNNPNVWQLLSGYLDNDNDDFGTGNMLQVCSGNNLPVGYSNKSGDCNDNNAAINPQAIEVCDGIDNNCNLQIDENLGFISCGFGVCQNSQPFCLNGFPSTCVPFWEKKSNEVCNALDDNCDGLIDNGLKNITCGFGLCRNTVSSCINGLENKECKPINENAKTEICDNIDNDCDGQINENLKKCQNTCTDTDKGINIFKKGTTSSEFAKPNKKLGSSFTDKCYNSTSVIEGYCDDSFSGWVKTEIVNCPNGYLCKKGACVK